jgi:hypothetical protein
MSGGRIIRLPVGFRVIKAGKVVRCTSILSIGAATAARVETCAGSEGKTDRRDQIGSYLQLSWAVGSEIKT